jgi:hypothetical protein
MAKKKAVPVSRTGKLQSPGITDGYLGMAVDPRKESGGKRKGRSMKRKPSTFRLPRVTLENLQHGRDKGGYYDGTLKCVVYHVEPTRQRTLKGYGKA